MPPYHNLLNCLVSVHCYFKMTLVFLHTFFPNILFFYNDDKSIQLLIRLTVVGDHDSCQSESSFHSEPLQVLSIPTKLEETTVSSMVLYRKYTSEQIIEASECFPRLVSIGFQSYFKKIAFIQYTKKKNFKTSQRTTLIIKTFTI